MKILLIRHHDRENINTRLPESINKVQGIYPPLGIGYIAAVLEKNGHKVSILDSQALNLTTQETKEKIAKANPDLVGITAMTPNIRGALEAARITKEVSKDIPTVIGGPHISVYPQETVKLPYIDYGVYGEGENVILDLVNSIEKKRISKVKGLVWKKGKDVKMNGWRIVEDLDSLPFPARHLMPHDKYSCVIAKHPFTTMITSRGCPFRCGFCFKGPSDEKYRFRKAEKVVDEMQHCIEKFKVKEIMFYDDTLTFSKNHITEICNEIISRGLDISWESPTRADCIDEEMLRLMKKSGCIRLRYGVESGNSEILKIMRKGIDLRKVEESFKLSKKIGIETFAYFIIGYPGENARTIRQTINFAKKLDPDWVMFTVATPLPKTDLFNHALKRGIVKEDYWLNFMLGKTDERIPFFVKNSDKWAKTAYKEFYLRPNFFLNKLLKINSLDTIRKYWKGFEGIVSFEMRGK